VYDGGYDGAGGLRGTCIGFCSCQVPYADGRVCGACCDDTIFDLETADRGYELD
jgi:hypothetical protein